MKIGTEKCTDGWTKNKMRLTETEGVSDAISIDARKTKDGFLGRRKQKAFSYNCLSLS